MIIKMDSKSEVFALIVIYDRLLYISEIFSYIAKFIHYMS